MNKQGFFQRMLILPGYNIDSSVNFFNLWRDSVAELDSDVRFRFYHHIKLDFEREARDECHAFAAFERLRYRMKHEPNSIVVEGHCNTCGLYRPAAFKLDGYMEMLHRAYPKGVIVTRCDNCKKDDTLEFPILSRRKFHLRYYPIFLFILWPC
jgi:hypothetical protein